MKRDNYGRIVNISSIWSKIGKEYELLTWHQFALDGFTIALASEYAKCGILANCVAQVLPYGSDSTKSRDRWNERNIGTNTFKAISKT